MIEKLYFMVLYIVRVVETIKGTEETIAEMNTKRNLIYITLHYKTIVHHLMMNILMKYSHKAYLWSKWWNSNSTSNSIDDIYWHSHHLTLCVVSTSVWKYKRTSYDILDQRLHQFSVSMAIWQMPSNLWLLFSSTRL